jgi:putative ABC transport system substrate-binding protein
MKRRNFLRLLGAAASWPLAAGAQQPKKRPVIGVLSPFIDADSTFLRDLRQGLGDRGLREGQEIAIEYRSAEGEINQLPVLAHELVRLKVDIIVGRPDELRPGPFRNPPAYGGDHQENPQGRGAAGHSRRAANEI